MQPLQPLEPQLVRQIDLLSNSAVALSLMAVRIPNLPRRSAAAAVIAAAGATDLIGWLNDGSLGVFTLRSSIPDDGSDIDGSFLLHLQSYLRNDFVPNGGIDALIAFRSVHVWSSEVTDADDLIAALFAVPAAIVDIGLAPAGMPAMLCRPEPSRPYLWP